MANNIKTERRQQQKLVQKPLRDTKDITFEGPSLNPKWLMPCMLAALIIGFVWIILFTLSGGTLPFEALGGWNIAIGFVLVLAGFLLATQWK